MSEFVRNHIEVVEGLNLPEQGVTIYFFVNNLPGPGSYFCRTTLTKAELERMAKLAEIMPQIDADEISVVHYPEVAGDFIELDTNRIDLMRSIRRDGTTVDMQFRSYEEGTNEAHWSTRMSFYDLLQKIENTCYQGRDYIAFENFASREELENFEDMVETFEKTSSYHRERR